MAKKAEFSIETVKKYIFWVCIPLGLVVAGLMTFLSVGSIGKAFAARKSALESQKSAVERIRTERDHPNEATIQEIRNQTKELRGRVTQAWKILEKDQRERNQWPDPLGEDFSNEVSKLKFGDSISVDARERYLNFIEDFLPHLEVYAQRRRIQVRDSADDPWRELDSVREVSASRDSLALMGGPEGTMSGLLAGGGGGGGGNVDSKSGTFQPRTNAEGVELEKLVGVVDWPSPETRTVTATWVTLPKSNEVWYAQEELWVYSALLWVIRTSNAGATGPHNAVVKRIESLLIGQLASQELSSQLSLRIGSGDGSPAGDSAGGGGDSMGSMVARTEEDVANMKKQFRYVNAEGMPLASTDAPPFAQFNRMPIVLRLIVDQRRIPEILVNCANCDMPIEVLRVRINPGAAKPFELSAYESAAGESGGGGGGDGMGPGVGYGSGGGGGGSGGGGGGGGGGDDVQFKVDGVGGIYGSNAVPVEIYGCINIFNPVEYDANLQSGQEAAAE